jgi:hypothetical protein
LKSGFGFRTQSILRILSCTNCATTSITHVRHLHSGFCHVLRLGQQHCQYPLESYILDYRHSSDRFFKGTTRFFHFSKQYFDEELRSPDRGQHPLLIFPGLFRRAILIHKAVCDVIPCLVLYIRLRRYEKRPVVPEFANGQLLVNIVKKTVIRPMECLPVSSVAKWLTYVLSRS